MQGYAKLSAWLVGAWFVFSLIAGGLGFYRIAVAQLPLMLGVGVMAPIVVFAAWFAASAGFREFALSLNPRVLTYIQTWRLEGFMFLALATYGILPKLFAWPAGWGDMTIGATAVLAALKLATPARRAGFIAWQALGIADLVNAVTMGTLAQRIDPHGIPTSAMSMLPMSMIPTFAVPLLLIFHIICIAQALRWRTEGARTVGRERYAELG